MDDLDIVREFLSESAENLSRLDIEIVELEKRPRDAELLGSIFRTVHTIKGTCGFLGFTTLGAITHAAETILSQVRDGQREASGEVVSLILEVVDATRAILQSIEATGTEGTESHQELRLRLKFAAESDGQPPAPVVAAAPAEPAEKDAETATRPAEGGTADATVRLHVTVLDALMNLAGELVLGRNQLNDAIARRDPTLIQAASQRLGAVTADVQDAVMRTRMQPVANLFQKFPRLVRDTAHKLGKSVNLVEEGADVELDKSVIEGLSDPLTHMVRNAIDHGIEVPAVRTSQGKPATGTLYLRAWHEAGLVVVEVADDGRGLDAGRLGATAVAKGLISAQANAAMTDDEKLALIFQPGFSTATCISDISGRGVGLDVVKTNLDQMGGKVEIQSRPGKGAAFRIKLPLTLAVIPSLLVSSGADRMAIPLANVQELVRIPAAETGKRIDCVGSARVLMLRDELVPLVDLAAALDLSGGDGRDGGAMNVVILSGGVFHYGLIVGRLHGTVDIVVKPLGRHVKHLREYAGATILGDGSVALILDVAGLAAAAGLKPRETLVQSSAAAVAAPEVTQHLLLFQNSATELCALPLEAVDRVLNVQPEQVERVGGRRTMQYRGRTLPLVMLSDVARATEVRLDRDSIVVVLEAGRRQFGLLGSRPVDVAEVALEIDGQTLRQRGIAGSAILRDRTVLVLDAAELAPAKQADQGEAKVLIGHGPAFFQGTKEKPAGRQAQRHLAGIGESK